MMRKLLTTLVYSLSVALCWGQLPDTTGTRTYAFTVEEDLLSLSVKKVALPQLRSLGLEETDPQETSYSMSIITADQIDKLGLRTIPEALRIVPGMLVREITRDNYDVSIRGATLHQQPGELYQVNASTILLLIDGRPWNNILDGAINWNTIPLSMQDIDRIEVFRHPLGVEQGMQAVEGVIHIITKTPNRNGIHGSGSAEFISPLQYRYQAAVEAGFRGRFNVRAGIQSFSSERVGDLSYYHLPTGQRFGLDTLPFIQSNVYDVAKFPSLSRKGYSFYTQLRYSGRKEGSATLGVFTGELDEQNMKREFGSLNLTHRYFSYQGISLEGTYKGFYGKTQIMLMDTADYAVGYRGLDLFENRSFLEFGYERTWKQLKVRTGFMVNSGFALPASGLDLQEFQDVAIADEIEIIQANSLSSLLTADVFLLAKYSLMEEKLLLHGGYRQPVSGDGNANRSPSFQAGASYKLAPRQTLRISTARTSGQPHVWENFYSNIESVVPGYSRWFNPDSTLPAIQSETLEIGYRGTFNNSGYIDVEAFRTRILNLPIALVTHDSTVRGDIINWMNSPLVPVKQGVSAGAQNIANNFQMGVSLTLLFNEVQNANFDLTAAQFWGSAYVTYTTPLDQLSVSAYGDFYTQEDVFDRNGEKTSLPGRGRLNAHISYQPWPNVRVYAQGKNLLNAQALDALYTDSPQRLINFGVSIDL